MARNFLLTMIRMNLVGMYSIVLALLIRLILRRISYRYAYALWLAVFLVLVLPVGIPVGFSIVPRMIAEPQSDFMYYRIEQTTAPYQDTFEKNDLNVTTDSAIQAPTAIDVTKSEPFNNTTPGAPLHTPSANDTASPDTMTQTSSGAYTASLPLSNLLFSKENKVIWNVCCIIWLFGMVTLFAREGIRYIRLRKYIASLELAFAPSAESNSLWTSNSGKLLARLFAVPQVVTLKDLRLPFVLGFLKPTIYLPNNMEKQEQYYILAHEQYHYYRMDTLTKFIVMLITFIYWYNPIIWLGYYYFCVDMELSCDEAVLQQFPPAAKKEYAASLLKYGALQNQYVISVLTFGEPNLKSRIQNVLHYKKKHVLVSCCAIAIVFIAALGLLGRPDTEKELLPESSSENTKISNVTPEDAQASDIPTTDASDDQLFPPEYTQKKHGDFDENGIPEYTVTFADPEITEDGFGKRLQFYYNDVCIYDYACPASVWVEHVEYLDLDQDQKEEIYICFGVQLDQYNRFKEYIVLKEQDGHWKPLEVFYGNHREEYKEEYADAMLDNAFPISFTCGSDNHIIITCERTEQALFYDLEPFWDKIYRENLDFESYLLHLQQDKDCFQEGTAYSRLASDYGTIDMTSGTFEGKNCLIATHNILAVPYYVNHGSYSPGKLDIYFNYDAHGNIQVLHLQFISTVQNGDAYLGTWHIDVEKTESKLKNAASLEMLFGSDFQYGNAMIFADDSLMHYYIGRETEETFYTYQYGGGQILAKKLASSLTGDEAESPSITDAAAQQTAPETIRITDAMDAENHLIMELNGELIFWIRGDSLVYEKMPEFSYTFSYEDLSAYTFHYGSGAGGWGTTLHIHEDGTFDGSYQDFDLGGYMAYVCDFSGKLSAPVKINHNTWIAQIETITQEKETGTEEVKDGIRYIYSDPYGLHETESLIFYMPAAPVGALPEGFRSWMNGQRWGAFLIDKQMNCYGIYNEKGDAGFTSLPEDVW